MSDNRLIAASILTMMSTNVMADNEDSTLLHAFCDAGRSALHISESPAVPPDSKGSHFTRETMDWSGLLIVGPQTNHLGDPLRAGSRIRKVHCGRFSAEVTSAYFNSNPQGELGAVDFPAVRLLLDKQEILPANAFYSAHAFGLGSGLYGDFPGRWADSIDARMINDSALITVQRSMESNSGILTTQTDTTVFDPNALKHSLCKLPERVVFQCSLKEKTVSVCASDSFPGEAGFVQYRFGRPGRVETMIPATSQSYPTDSVAWLQERRESGQASYLRFNRGEWHYFVYSMLKRVTDAQGSLVVVPPDQAGVVVTKGNERVFSQSCRGPVFDANMSPRFWGSFVKTLPSNEGISPWELVSPDHPVQSGSVTTPAK